MSTDTSANGGALRLLVVDDDEFDRRAARFQQPRDGARLPERERASAGPYLQRRHDCASVFRAFSSAARLNSRVSASE